MPIWIKGIVATDAPNIIRYCSKAETRVAGPHENGKIPDIPKKRSTRDYDAALQLVKEGRYLDCQADVLIPYLGNLQKLSAQFTTPITVGEVRGEWFYGAPGSGKSLTASRLFPNAYRKMQNKWWDNYAQQENVILDDLDQQGSCLGHYLKIWTDHYDCYGEIKGGTVALNHKRFVVTSNYEPEDLWPNDKVLCEAIRRRFRFRRFAIADDIDWQDIMRTFA